MKQMIFLTFMLLFIAINSAHPSYATPEDNNYGRYECHADRAFIWEGGKLKENTFMRKLGIVFQQDSSFNATLSTGMKSPWETRELKITHNPTNSGDIVASNMKSDQYDTTTTVMRIREWDKSLGIVFFLTTEFSGELILSGHCQHVAIP